ncbi:hypothetical protein A2U01_0104145 [Trifolium medium]|uniref:Uncharacterized protein n=1 Tax=Trifolium medium TaxID=97028 RepID=A0A392V7E2_9FABA|nr:hypothetical protein [Trifolium medium]
MIMTVQRLLKLTCPSDLTSDSETSESNTSESGTSKFDPWILTFKTSASLQSLLSALYMFFGI